MKNTQKIVPLPSRQRKQLSLLDIVKRNMESNPIKSNTSFNNLKLCKELIYPVLDQIKNEIKEWIDGFTIIIGVPENSPYTTFEIGFNFQEGLYEATEKIIKNAADLDNVSEKDCKRAAYYTINTLQDYCRLIMLHHMMNTSHQFIVLLASVNLISKDTFEMTSDDQIEELKKYIFDTIDLNMVNVNEVLDHVLFLLF